MNLPPQDLQRIADFVSLANRNGFDTQINISISLGARCEPGEPGGERATARTVQWALNRLKAAAGQPNRDLVRKFLFVRGWIAGADEPEQWDLDHVPTTKPEIAIIASQVAVFEKTHTPRKL